MGSPLCLLLHKRIYLTQMLRHGPSLLYLRIPTLQVLRSDCFSIFKFKFPQIFWCLNQAWIFPFRFKFIFSVLWSSRMPAYTTIFDLQPHSCKDWRSKVLDAIGAGNIWQQFCASFSGVWEASSSGISEGMWTLSGPKILLRFSYSMLFDLLKF